MMLISTLLVAELLASGRAAVARPALDGGITIDGDLSDWSPGLYGVAPPIPLNSAVSATEEGPAPSMEDFHADFFAVVGPKSITFAGLVIDDELKHFRGGEMWRGDMVEILLADPRGPSDYLHVGVAPSGDVFVFHPLGPKKAPLVIAGLRAAAKQFRAGYSVEVEIPFTGFGVKDKTTRFELNFAARDADSKDTTHSHLTWSGYRHNLRASFGTLIVDSTAEPKVAWPTCPKPIHVKIEKPLMSRGKELIAGETPVVLRMVNYQSARENWPNFWTSWDLARIRRDLDMAAKLNINSIRIFVFFGPFGGAKPTAEMLSRLDAVIDEAARRGILSVISFFPFDKDFREERFKEMSDHLRAIVSRYKGDPAIAMWDLMNEPDHMWQKGERGITAADVDRWTKKMLAVTKEADPTHLVTVGLAGHFAVDDKPIREEEALPYVDVISVHWYFDPARLAAGLARAQSIADKPLILQEFGATGRLYDEVSAAAHYTHVCSAAATQKIAGLAAWELFDHPVGTIAHYDRPWEEADDNYFGLLKADGTPKKTAGVYCSCLEAPMFSLPRSERSVTPKAP